MAACTGLYSLVNSCIGFLYINPRHAYFVKLLYLIIYRLVHSCQSMALPLKIKLDMRQKHKSNVAGFHSAKGGAVPTLTHQNSDRIAI